MKKSTVLIVLVFLLLTGVALANYQDIVKPVPTEIGKKLDEDKLIRLSKEEWDVVYKGSIFMGTGAVRHMHQGEKAKDFASQVDVSISEVKVHNQEGELIPINFQIDITNNGNSELYFYDFYLMDYEGIPIWDKEAYNVKIDSQSTKTLNVDAWMPIKSMAGKISVKDLLEKEKEKEKFEEENKNRPEAQRKEGDPIEEFFNFKMVVSSTPVDIDAFLREVKYMGPAGEPSKYVQLYIIEESCKAFFTE
ncbi:MAG: hypothetical protein VR72_00225 [Clostridiaceae bacterium BRH_c20a]|nr:MAG: hypothetical protein VR72_00225 [Clostridiaceae bacterium BRH_c20a]